MPQDAEETQQCQTTIATSGAAQTAATGEAPRPAGQYNFVRPSAAVNLDGLMES